MMPVSDVNVGVRPPSVKSKPVNSSPASRLSAVVLVNLPLIVSAAAFSINSAVAETACPSNLVPEKVDIDATACGALD